MSAVYLFGGLTAVGAIILIALLIYQYGGKKTKHENS